MMRDLPEQVHVNGKRYAIRKRCDYRVALDCMAALGDERLEPNERLACALIIFYDDLDFKCASSDLDGLAKELERIVGGGETEHTTGRRLKPIVDFEKDFPLIVSALLPVLGYDIREKRHLHWWTFLSAFREIRTDTYAYVLRIREKRARGIALEKDERAFYAQNRSLVDITFDLTDDEREFLFGRD